MAFRLSNNLVGILNFLTFLLSIPILSAGIWLSREGVTECERFLEKPVIVIGVFLMLVSLAGLIGACCRVTWLLWLYLVVMFLLIVLGIVFTIFAFAVTNKGAGETLSGKVTRNTDLYLNVSVTEFYQEHLSSVQSGCCWFIDNLRSSWKKVAAVNIVFLVFLIVYSVGCCAFRNNRRENYYQQQQQPWKP
ncbi:putative Nodulin MtN21 /EamA-like transporter family protein [Hibiscus syriacus]|uniref:Nodulin MtN21 /EamA-like transporter family protein n=1 Tax=Hibiscus syriacus TaxID=106335 RepID=A0A6A2Z7P2_HIBSY|nr:putative Nodulin MtN21 /EamA-like transporter family protein [Hibiscus syriacus]